MSAATYYQRHVRSRKRRLAEAPPAPAPVPAPEATKIVGFWCIPIPEAYVKLKINERYTLDDKHPVMVDQSIKTNVSFAILANAQLLSRFCPWVAKELYRNIQTGGADVFTNPQNKGHQKALRQLAKAAVLQNWLYVVAQGSTAYIGYDKKLPEYAPLLEAELTKGNRQKPTNVFVSGIKNVIGIGRSGPEAQQPVETFFKKLKDTVVEPVKAFTELIRDFGVNVQVKPGEEDEEKNRQAVTLMHSELDKAMNADKTKAQSPENLAKNKVVNDAMQENEYDFLLQVIAFYRKGTATGGRPKVVAHKIMILVAKYGANPDPDEWGHPDLKYLADFVAPDGKNIDDEHVETLLSAMTVHLDPQNLNILNQMIASLKETLRRAGPVSTVPPVPPAPLPKPPALPKPAAAAPALTPPTASVESLIEAVLSEMSFRTLYNSTAANGLYQQGGMRKVVGLNGAGQSVTHWVFDSTVPGRIANSRFVVTKPPTPTIGPDGLPMIKFNFKSRADRSTTSLRALGFVKFLKAGRGRPKTEIDREVHTYCSCPDFKYRWHKALADAGAAHTPSGIGGEATNVDPVYTNPEKKIAICKHLCAMHDYLGQKKSDYAASLGPGPTRTSKTGKSVMMVVKPKKPVIPVGDNKPAKVKQNATVSKRPMG